MRPQFHRFVCSCLLLCAMVCTANAQSSAFLVLDFDDGTEQSVTPTAALRGYEDNYEDNDEVAYHGEAADLQQRVERLEAELNHIRCARPDVLGTLQQQIACSEVGSGGVYASLETTFLRPQFSGATPFFGLAAPGGRAIDSNYDPGLRYVLGYQSDSGIGIRARYWTFDNSYAFTRAFAQNDLGIDMDVVDTEVTLTQHFMRWDLEVSGGLRYGKLEYSTTAAGPFGIGLLTFEGVGPTLSMGAQRRLGDTGLSIFGNVRGSWLIGDIRNGSLLAFMPRGTIEEEILQVYENQLGMAWTRNFGANSTLQLRTAWETQFWLNDTLADDVYGIGTNLGFMGPTITAEVRF